MMPGVSKQSLFDLTACCVMKNEKGEKDSKGTEIDEK